MRYEILPFENIRNLRIDRGFTQQQVAEYLNIRQNAYAQYEIGVLNYPIDVLEAGGPVRRQRGLSAWPHGRKNTLSEKDRTEMTWPPANPAHFFHRSRIDCGDDIFMSGGMVMERWAIMAAGKDIGWLTSEREGLYTRFRGEAAWDGGILPRGDGPRRDRQGAAGPEIQRCGPAGLPRRHRICRAGTGGVCPPAGTGSPCTPAGTGSGTGTAGGRHFVVRLSGWKPDHF